MAKITIELDTSNDEDAALAAKLFAGAPPKSRKGGDQGYSYATPFPTIQPSVEVPESVPNGAANVGFVPAAFTHGSPELDADAAKLEALAGPGSAGPVFAVPTPPATGTVELDAAGLPWDARIHSESRARIADNTWRRKRGVDQVVVDLVTSELRAAYPAPTGQPAPAPNPFPVQPPERTDVPPPPAAPVTAPPPPAARGVPDLAAAVARGTLSLADLNAACLLHGCANVLELNKNPAALTAVCAQFDAIGAFQ